MLQPKKYRYGNRTFTVRSLADELNCSDNAAKRRLVNQQYNTLEQLLSPVKKQNSGSSEKIYIVDNTEISARSLAQKLNCSLPNARHRIYNCTTLEDLYRPVGCRGRKTVKKQQNPGLNKLNKLLFGAW